MAELPQLQRLLLDLIAPRPVIAASRVAALDAAAWGCVLRMVRQHRLGPLLHWQLTRTRPDLPIPQEVREGLAADFKRSTRRALEMRRELVLVHRLLAAAGIPYLALKGAYLAFHAYPQPGLRPLRDLDILVPGAEALRAFEVLIAGGLTRPEQYQGDPRARLQVSNHLPPLSCASGQATVELHARLVNPEEGHPERADLSDDPAFWRRGITAQAGREVLSFPAPTDLLLHLIEHAAYYHRFNNGPLLLSDLAYLLGSQAIDWGLFWRLADRGGFTRGCWLALKLVERYWGTSTISWVDGMPPDTDEADQRLDEAALLMLRDLDRVPGIYVVGAMQSRSLTEKLKLLYEKTFPAKSRIERDFPIARESPRFYLYYLKHWRRLACQRLPQFLTTRRNTCAQDELRQLAQFEHWLAGDVQQHDQVPR